MKQTEWVVKQLKENGQVSRNNALTQRITRLGAIVNDLNHAGWNVKGKYERTYGGYGRGLDYVYKNKNQ